MATAFDLIKGALRRINSYQSGDQIAAPDANDCLETLNDMLDSWSTDQDAVFGSIENILYFTGGKYQYTIGNPPGGSFIGNVVGNTITVSPPTGLSVGATLTDLSAVIPIGTTVTAITPTTVTMSNLAIASAVGDEISYSSPGDFAIPRPLRITNAFTRITTQGTGYDYPIEIISQDRYVEYGLKSIPYPWPTALWYNNTYPLGTISFYGQPSGGGELHLFTDTILANLTLNQTFQLPQGYARALKWMLAREICSEFGFPLTPAIEKLAEESFSMIKALNAQPVPESKIDAELLGDVTDAGWILFGGYR